MKVQASIRDVYATQLEINERLQPLVDAAMLGLKDRRWHYESRVKSLESFALKLETGRVAKPSALEDFLACTIVVPNSQSIAEAVHRLEERLFVDYRRPPSSVETKKPVDSFPFDDLRMYCCLGNDGSVAPTRYDSVLFEVQVKTFLQHAWSVATHDVSYKTDTVSWGKDRVVAQLKAAIEHVELSLQEVAPLADSPLVALNNPQVILVSNVIDVLKRYWKRDELPDDLRRLANTVADLLVEMDMAANDLDTALYAEVIKNTSLPLNLSPYGAVLRIVMNERSAELENRLARRGRLKVLLTPELDVPAGYPKPAARHRTVKV